MSRPYTIENVLATPIAQAIDPDIVKEIVSGPPFVHIPGKFNARDIGNDRTFGVRSGFIWHIGERRRVYVGSLAKAEHHSNFRPATVDNDSEQRFQAKVAQNLNVRRPNFFGS
ncbi:hypothetical protein CERZMDRAFT_96964 [Cercospora zeae-maydis SCOH1-5]|uniref:Uncharacterized protein n=1 Tax=Cercospora zeae-maydis SCOH1-5 TaxID=717836 RepID=A0A6A6FIN9_9PEZI|nr:hypothetical protein CERZMDRAFT_96964 [Cercospora zeae-maydis SCOH1-5]